MGSHDLGCITVYSRRERENVYALACRICDRARPATATLMRSQVPAADWAGAVWGFLLSHMHGPEVRAAYDDQLPFPQDGA